jgi:Xaa-Pro aminopeptidase
VNCHSGRWPRENHLILGLSTERKLENDSVVDMDGGCTYKGYWSDFSRMFGVGKPPAKAIAGYRVAQAAIAAGIEAVKPGNPISDVYRAMAGAFAKANSRDQVSETGMSETGLNGHGLGLSSTERPYVNINDTTIMAPGLYFCVEPIFSIEGYGMVFGEEMVVVTETGSEILSERAEPELPIVG